MSDGGDKVACCAVCTSGTTLQLLRINPGAIEGGILLGREGNGD
jgi:hypothetical protein